MGTYQLIGTHEFSIKGGIEKRGIFPYTQWMFQRPVFHYQALADDDRRRADELLKKLGGYDGMQVRIKKPVVRVNNLLTSGLAEPPKE